MITEPATGVAHTPARVLTPAGGEILEWLRAARHAGLAEHLAGWAPDEHREFAELLRRLARDLAAEAPGT